MGVQKHKVIKWNIPCEYHDIMEANLVFNPSSPKDATIKIGGFESAEAYSQGHPPTSVEMIKVPYAVVIAAVSQTEKSMAQACWEWIMTNVPFYSDGTWVDL